MRRRNIAFLTLIILASFIVYLNAIKGDFVFDDVEVIVRSEFIKNIGNALKIFSPQYFELSSEMSYRPVVTLSYLLDHTIWGLKSPGYRFTNIILHAANAALLYLFLRKILGSSPGAFLGAIIFAVHPALTEAVSVPSYREDLLAFLFYIAALLSYLRGRGEHRERLRRWLFYPLHYVSFMLALFSKEMAATLPAIVFLLDRAFLAESERRSDFRFSIKHIGHFAILGFYLIVRFYLLKNPREELLFEAGMPAAQRSVAALSVAAQYLRLLFFPLNLNAFYDFSPSLSPPMPLIASSIAMALFLLALVFSCWWAGGGFAAAASWFLISLGPVYNFVPLNVPLAERYIYLPSAAFSIAAAMSLSRFSIRADKRPDVHKLKIASFIAFALIIFCFSALTMSRNMIWRNELTLWADTAKKSPGSAVVRNNLGNAYLAKAEADKAIAEYKIALRADKERLWVVYNLAYAYLTIGRDRLAIAQYKAALTLNPDFILALANLTNLLAKNGDLDEALRYGQRAMEINPFIDKLHASLSEIYTKIGLKDKAAASFKTFQYLKSRGEVGKPGLTQPAQDNTAP